MSRINGFERPWTLEQISTWISMPIASIAFYLVVSAFSPASALVPLLVVHSVLMVLMIALWLHCSLADPRLDRGPYWPCMKEAQKTSRYCATCKKMVPGLDHHCTWLNTCVGKRQYPSFFALVMIGTALTWFQAAVFILMMTVWFNESRIIEVLGSDIAYYVLLSLAAILSFALAVSVSVLAAFHIYLQFVGIGTYGYILLSRQKSLSRARLRREKQRQASAPSENLTNKSSEDNADENDSKPPGSEKANEALPV